MVVNLPLSSLIFTFPSLSFLLIHMFSRVHVKLSKLRNKGVPYLGGHYNAR